MKMSEVFSRLRYLMQSLSHTNPRHIRRSLVSPRANKHKVRCVWRSGNGVGRINEVTLCQSRLVLGWVTVSGLDSQRRHFISVCNQPSRSTQPSTLRGTVK